MSQPETSPNRLEAHRIQRPPNGADNFSTALFRLVAEDRHRSRGADGQEKQRQCLGRFAQGRRGVWREEAGSYPSQERETVVCPRLLGLGVVPTRVQADVAT